MNHKDKPSKKILFEPKIPLKTQEIVVNPTKTQEEIPKAAENSGSLKGMFAPVGFSIAKQYTSDKKELVLNNLSEENFEDAYFVEFSDGTFGIQQGDLIIDCENAFIGDGIIVEIDDKVKKVGTVEYMMTL
jgi:hypothetical protein